MFEKLSEFSPLLVAFVVYPLLVSQVFRLNQKILWPVLAFLSVFGSYIVGVLTVLPHFVHGTNRMPHVLFLGSITFVFYVALVIASFAALGRAKRSTRDAAVAYVLPITMLILLREVLPALAHLDRSGSALILVGVSYISFKLSHLVSEVLNEIVPMPSLSKYLAYSFFLPLIFVGPIATYSSFYSSTLPDRKPVIDVGRALLRILVGFVKYAFLSAVFAEFSYGIAFLGDGHLHSKLDLAIAVLIYPLFIFCNFSGMCDISIGVSGLMGIEVMENFDRPFSSRNFQEFWTRWHMSLTKWMTSMVFTPLVKQISRKVPPKMMQHVVASGTMLCFLLIGLWHGFKLNFVLYGLSQGLGVVAVQYWTVFTRKRLQKEQYLKLRSNKVILWISIAANYLYFSLTLVLFANSTGNISSLLAIIR